MPLKVYVAEKVYVNAKSQLIKST